MFARSSVQSSKGFLKELRSDESHQALRSPALSATYTHVAHSLRKSTARTCWFIGPNSNSHNKLHWTRSAERNILSPLFTVRLAKCFVVHSFPRVPFTGLEGNGQ